VVVDRLADFEHAAAVLAAPVRFENLPG